MGAKRCRRQPSRSSSPACCDGSDRLNGVYGWRTRNDRGGKAALADFELVAWEGRRVVIAPDGDVKENPNVLHAVQRLGRLRTARYGVAELLVCYLPQPRGG